MLFDQIGKKSVKSMIETLFPQKICDGLSQIVLHFVEGSTGKNSFCRKRDFSDYNLSNLEWNCFGLNKNIMITILSPLSFKT